MKMVKGLLLGTAAGLAAMAGAQAADLPVKAAPVQYVKICSLYGAGFYYIPGTDTCLKVGGYVRAEYNFNAGGSFNPILNGVNALHNRNSEEINSRVRAIITFDAREQTEYGTLRAYIAGGWQSDNGARPTEATAVYRFFVQLAGFTAGFTTSYFDHFSWSAYSNNTNVIGSDTAGSGVTAFAYTAQFGGGVSGSISIEDGRTRRTNVINVLDVDFTAFLAVPPGPASGFNAQRGFDDNYATARLPDLVGNIRIDQAWGSAQLMGALHQVRGNYFDGTEDTGHPDDELGWALGAGVRVNLPFISQGDHFSIQGTYTEGAARYAGQNLPQNGSQIAVYDGGTVGFGFDSDAVYDGGLLGVPSDLELTKTWSVVAGFSHNWTPNVRTSIYGAYLRTDYDAEATAFLNEALLPIAATLGDGNPDFSYFQVGSRTVWSPVKNLDLSLDVMYNKLETGYEGAVLDLAPGGGKPRALYGVTDQEWWMGMVRVQRNFYP